MNQYWLELLVIDDYNYKRTAQFEWLPYDVKY